MGVFHIIHNILCITRPAIIFHNKTKPAAFVIFAPRGLHIMMVLYTLRMSKAECKNDDNELFRCPCCGYYTLPGSGQYDICPVCFWEDDPFQEDDPDLEGGANEPSLNECRKNYEVFHACEERYMDRVRPPRPEEIR